MRLRDAAKRQVEQHRHQQRQVEQQVNVRVEGHDTLLQKSSALILHSCKMLAGVKQESHGDSNIIKMRLSMNDGDDDMKEGDGDEKDHEVSYGKKMQQTPPPSPSASSSSGAVPLSTSPPLPQENDASPAAVSNDEVLFVRAFLSMCRPERPITIHLRDRQDVQAERPKSALRLLAFLHEHRFAWYFHPAVVSKNLASDAEVSDGTEPVSRVAVDTEKVIDAARKVLLPVSVSMHTSHIKNEALSSAQKKVVAEKEKHFTPQQLDERARRKEKRVAKTQSEGCVHSAKHLASTLEPMYQLGCWNRTVEDGGKDGRKRGNTFEKRVEHGRTTVADVFQCHDLQARPSSSSPLAAMGEEGEQPKNKPEDNTKRRFVYLQMKDCQHVITKRKTALKAHDTRVGKGNKGSSPINPASWTSRDDGSLRSTGLSLEEFRANSKKSLSGVPLQTRHAKLQLVTSEDQCIVTRKDRSATKDPTKVTTLAALGRSRRSVTIKEFSYNFAAFTTTRQTLRFRGRGAWLNLRPGEDQTSGARKTGGLGAHLRPGARVELDFTTGEITYCPASKAFRFHAPLTADTLVIDSQRTIADVAQMEEELARARVRGKTTPVVNDEQPLDTEQQFVLVYDKMQQIKNKRGPSFRKQQRRLRRRLRRNVPHVFGPRDQHSPPATPINSAPAPATEASSSSKPHCSQCVSEDNCPTRGRQHQAPELPSGGRITWRKGLDDVPPALRDWDPGVDPFGVAYVGITRHSDDKRKQVCKQVRETDFGCGKWCVSGDPNITSFYEFYVPASGSVVDIGKGWAQRVLDKWGRKVDRAQSEVDAIINKELAGILDEKKALSMEGLKLEKTELMRKLETTNPIYRQKRGEIVKVRA